MQSNEHLHKDKGAQKRQQRRLRVQRAGGWEVRESSTLQEIEMLSMQDLCAMIFQTSNTSCNQSTPECNTADSGKMF
jgi:hypothetical protein